MTIARLRTHLLKLANKAKHRSTKNKRFESRLRASGEARAYENAAGWVALLEVENGRT